MCVISSLIFSSKATAVSVPSRPAWMRWTASPLRAVSGVDVLLAADRGLLEGIDVLVAQRDGHAFLLASGRSGTWYCWSKRRLLWHIARSAHHRGLVRRARSFGHSAGVLPAAVRPWQRYRDFLNEFGWNLPMLAQPNSLVDPHSPSRIHRFARHRRGRGRRGGWRTRPGDIVRGIPGVDADSVPVHRVGGCRGAPHRPGYPRRDARRGDSSTAG